MTCRGMEGGLEFNKYEILFTYQFYSYGYGFFSLE